LTSLVLFVILRWWSLMLKRNRSLIRFSILVLLLVLDSVMIQNYHPVFYLFPVLFLLLLIHLLLCILTVLNSSDVWVLSSMPGILIQLSNLVSLDLNILCDRRLCCIGLLSCLSGVIALWFRCRSCRTSCLDQSCNCLRIVDDKVIDIIIVDNICNSLTFILHNKRFLFLVDPSLLWWCLLTQLIDFALIVFAYLIVF